MRLSATLFVIAALVLNIIFDEHVLFVLALIAFPVSMWLVLSVRKRDSSNHKASERSVTLDHIDNTIR